MDTLLTVGFFLITLAAFPLIGFAIAFKLPTL